MCGREKCALRRRPYRPGQHGKGRIRVSEFGKQLTEKQKLKLLYGVRERQFQNYFKQASNAPEPTGEALVRSLEMRLDNVVFRLGFATTRSQARQLVSHGHFTVNGRRTTIPSYRVRVKDRITFRPQSKDKSAFKELPTTLKKYEPPHWMALDKEAFAGEITALPSADITRDVPVEVAQIVEYYSR